MEHNMTCNNLKCRRELSDRALVTTCSHIFCLDCAQQLGVTIQNAERRTNCPACKSELPNPDDAVIANLNPSEDYKTSVLSGLSPNIIMECAGRALSFWAYQTTQDICYQQYLNKTLAEKYSSLHVQFDKAMHDANSEVESLQNRINGMSTEHETTRRKYDELSQAYREKTRKLLQTQELYDKVKRKAEMGSLQQAALDAVDSTVHMASQKTGQMYEEVLLGSNEGSQNPSQQYGYGPRFDGLGAMNTSLPRSNPSGFHNNSHWVPNRNDSVPEYVGGPMRQRLGLPGSVGTPSFRGLAGTPRPTDIQSRRNFPKDLQPQGVRAGLSGVGLTSGLKISEPTSGLAVNNRGRRY